MPNMYVELRIGEVLQMTSPGGQTVRVTLLQKSGQRARIAVQAPRDTKIERTPPVQK